MAKKNKNKNQEAEQAAAVEAAPEAAPAQEVVAEYTAQTNDDGTATVTEASEGAPVKAGDVLTGEAKAEDADAARAALLKKRQGL